MYVYPFVYCGSVNVSKILSSGCKKNSMRTNSKTFSLDSNKDDSVNKEKMKSNNSSFEGVIIVH